MKVIIKKKVSKWAIYTEDGKRELYIGKTRVECFRFISENKFEIVAYQHGGK